MTALASVPLPLRPVDPSRPTSSRGALPLPSAMPPEGLSDWQVALLLGGSAVSALAVALTGAVAIDWLL